MLVPAETLTGYVRKDCQIRWLSENGFKHGRNWWEQKKNGKIIVLMAESIPPESVVKLNLSALGPKAKKSEAPTGKAVPSARKVSAKMS
jgi:hypothetical protein